MSGTSLDGVDAALIETDGHEYARPLAFVSLPYEPEMREQIRACFGISDHGDISLIAAAKQLTLRHGDAIVELLRKAGSTGNDIDVIGFHGQTVFHAPQKQQTLQIGDGMMLARLTGIDVVDDFRSRDVRAGGEGAPLAPLYHAARARTQKIETPAVILNIGGVSNVTYICGDEHDILAFDTGPGNALMDDWARKHTGALYDADGALAAKGQPVRALLDQWLAHPYFARKPPKSLDRNEWDIAELGKLAQEIGGASTEDGAATLLAFTVESIVKSMDYMPAKPKAWYVCGGGRRNVALMNALKAKLPKVEPVEALGWDGDATEAECPLACRPPQVCRSR